MKRFKKFNVFLVIYGTIIISILLGGIYINHYTPDKFYHNLNMKIVQWDYNCSTTNDKFHKPQLCNAILFETVINGDTLYREINTCDKEYTIKIDTEWLYNHQIGDTCHFGYLLKDKFFKIKKR